ncbi:unnamed protein product [Brassicogethes aeneus]|uniref:CLIP domain-containing serine protease n=1 Tax=Brassicogethes aeneus TaxID=1431903 RepID=A0A9P0FEM2_BRAAE|nr:unnamed protein product [Brassicogethes aeneus]
MLRTLVQMKQINVRSAVVFVACFVISSVKPQWAYEDDNSKCSGSDECIPIKQCRPMLDLIQSFNGGVPYEIQQKLKEYRCGFSGLDVKVCCPSSTLQGGKGDPLPPDVSRHKNFNLLPQNCGYLDSSNRIVKGNKTGLFEFPWMALISYQTASGAQFGCGGTILNEKYILTAAHCISDLILKPRRRSLLGVRVGDHDIDSPKDCETTKGITVCAPPYQDFRIEKAVPHEQYNPNANFNNDIGLIRVDGTMNLNKENIKPVCLPVGPGRLYQFGNNKGVVTGWGATETSTRSSDLLQAHLPLISWGECSRNYKNRNFKSPITYKHLCAGGTGNQDSCAGDSGGPLHAVVPNEDTGETKYTQQGIVSFGPKNCGADGFPGVYTKVSYYMDWVLDNMRR